MFCPKCIAEDAIPYFKRRWRLAFSTICTKHKYYLLDACPKCKSPIEPHRSDMQGRGVFPHGSQNVHCWKCSFDLRASLGTEVTDESILKLLIRLEFALDNGYANWAGNPTMHSIVFFDGLRELTAGITSRHVLERLMKSDHLSGIRLTCWPHTGLEMASLPLRRELFRMLAIALEDWPHSFAELIHECNLRYADLKGDSVQRAYWYEKVIRSEGGGGYSLIGHEEAEAIARAVETKHGHFTFAAARKLSGRNIDLHVPDRMLHPVSDDVYEDLLTSIDHQIAGTLDKTERACLIRDKVMFAVGRQLKLSEVALAALTLERVRALVPDEVELDFSDVVRSPAQARAWVEWYWVEMRSQLQPEPDVDCVFTSAITHRGFRHSAVGSRFQKIVHGGMMHRSIQNFGCFTNRKLR